MVFGPVDLAELIVLEDATLLDGLKAIERGRSGVALLCDSVGRLKGLVTDGDLRRALIRGVPMGSPLAEVASQAPLVVSPSVSRPHVLDLMRARGINEVPVVDQESRVVSLHQLNRIVCPNHIPNTAVVMAGGLGSRLGGLTKSQPKPMLPVAGRPVLEWIILHLVGEGIKDVIVSTGHRAEAIEEHFGDGESFGCTVSFLRDPDGVRLGSGGPLGLLKPERLSGHPAVVLNGDLVTRFDLRSMLAHHSQQGASMTIAKKRVQRQLPFGVLETDDSGNLEAIIEKPEMSWPVNAGIYVIEPELIETVDTHREFPMTELALGCLKRREIVATWEIEGDWIDIGLPEDLARARGNA